MRELHHCQHTTVCRNERQRWVPTVSCLQSIIIPDIADSIYSASHMIMGYETTKTNKMIHTCNSNSFSVLTSVCFVIAWNIIATMCTASLSFQRHSAYIRFLVWCKLMQSLICWKRNGNPCNNYNNTKWALTQKQNHGNPNMFMKSP
jgi:hypothetical protein